MPLPVSSREIIQTMLARAYLAQGEAEKALAVLEPLLPPAEAAGGLLRVIEVCLLKALALQALGDAPAALISLERALTLAEPEGYVGCSWTKARRWPACSTRPPSGASCPPMPADCSLLSPRQVQHPRQVAFRPHHPPSSSP